jgi:hypothetical protein
MADDAAPFALDSLEPATRLDLQLTYLWNVHGVDYYAGGCAGLGARAGAGGGGQRSRRLASAVRVPQRVLAGSCASRQTLRSLLGRYSRRVERQPQLRAWRWWQALHGRRQAAEALMQL